MWTSPRTRYAFWFGCLILLVTPGFRSAAATATVDREFRECADCIDMVGIPGGSFMMGSPATEEGRFDSEGPQHLVTLRAFALAKYDVSSAQFLAFLKATGYSPAPCNAMLGLGWHSPGHGMAYPPDATEPLLWPATCLSWDDAQAYIRWLNDKVRGLASAAKSTNGPYRLPSEAEWEYAARGGTTSARWWGNAIGVNQANCKGCGSQWDGRLFAPVDQFGPNPFGLYGVLGNVWQWVEDCWHESYVGAPTDGRAWLGHAGIGQAGVTQPEGSQECAKRVMRGGSWINLPVFVRSASRSRGDQDGYDFDYSSFAGIRVARNLP